MYKSEDLASCKGGMSDVADFFSENLLGIRDVLVETNDADEDYSRFSSVFPEK